MKLVRSGRIRGELVKYLPKIYSSRLSEDGIRVTVIEKLRPYYATEFGVEVGHAKKMHFKELLRPYTPTNCFIDMGCNNIMYREDNTPIITDPWAAGPT